MSRSKSALVLLLVVTLTLVLILSDQVVQSKSKKWSDVTSLSMNDANSVDYEDWHYGRYHPSDLSLSDEEQQTTKTRNTKINKLLKRIDSKKANNMRRRFRKFQQQQQQSDSPSFTIPKPTQRLSF